MLLHIPLFTGRGRWKATKTKDVEEFGALGKSYRNFARKFVLTRHSPASWFIFVCRDDDRLVSVKRDGNSATSSNMNRISFRTCIYMTYMAVNVIKHRHGTHFLSYTFSQCSFHSYSSFLGFSLTLYLQEEIKSCLFLIIITWKNKQFFFFS